MKERTTVTCVVLAVAAVVLAAASLFTGTVRIPVGEVLAALVGGKASVESWNFIVLESRMPSMVVSVLAGCSLAASGLMLQTAFRNPLAGPDILGINGGAGLGVALVMMAFGGNLSIGAMTIGCSLSVVAGAFIGAMAVMGIVLLLSSRLRNPVTLLIAGVMISYLTSSAISLLNFFSTAEGVHSYTMWGMGNFGGVSSTQLSFYGVVTLLGLSISLLLIKSLNAMLLGDMYAENLGINIKRTRTLLLLSTGLLVAVTTAFCGPISFLGLAVPHLARLVLGTGNHQSLMPVTILTGAVVALLCNLLSSLPGDKGLIPLNAITPIIGAPVVLYVLLSSTTRRPIFRRQARRHRTPENDSQVKGL